MKKNSFLIASAFILSLSSYAQPVTRQRLLMDMNWKFSQTDTAGAMKPGFNDSKWRTLNLPHDWSIEGAFKEEPAQLARAGFLPTGIGWYRKHFMLPTAAASKNVWIEFDGIYQNSDVWINGQYLGHYPNGYMSFNYELTKFLKKRDNILTVKVDNSLQPNTRWYSGAGIYRHVWLNIANPLHIAQWGAYITTPKADSASAVVAVKTTINNSIYKNVSLRSIVTNAKGNEVSRIESPVTVDAGKPAIIEQKLNIITPLLWSVDDPYLYNMKSLVVSNGKIVDEVNTSFGIRDIQFTVEKGFLLNGKQVKMNGVCLHHDAGSVGAAVPEAMWVRRLKLLKEMGCNAIRTSHNPMAPEFLDLCDKMGFLVMNEVFDEWKSGKVKYGYNMYFNEWSQHDLINFIHRDRNHPSVVIWSAGNEILEQRVTGGDTVLQALLQAFHKEDPTRPVTTGNDYIAADDGSARVSFLNMLDIVGYNYVDRWRKRRELYYSIDHHDHPDWKMIGTENVSMRGVRGNYFGGNYPAVDSSIVSAGDMPTIIRAEQLWKFTATHDYVMGDFMWTGIDYLGEARWPNKNSNAGVIDLCGFPKDGYYFYQSQWTTKPMLHVFPHWNWKGREGKIIPVTIFTNCDTVELFVNGRSFGMKSMEFPRQGNANGWNVYAKPKVNATTADLHLSWDVPFEAGTIKAVGRKDGKIVLQKELYTTGAPVTVQLSADTATLNITARDVAHIKIAVVDANGLLVPDANNLLQVAVSGAGKLIGLDNGNPTDLTPMKSNQRKLFNGLALAVVQTTNEAGNIKVTVSSAGLKEASFNITSIKK
jgi:beta-galactosidase